MKGEPFDMLKECRPSVFLRSVDGLAILGVRSLFPAFYSCLLLSVCSAHVCNFLIGATYQ